MTADYDPERLRRAIHDKINERMERAQQRMDRAHERWERSFVRRQRRHSGAGGLVAGIVLAGIGVLFLLQNLGILYVEDVWQYWPAILIVFGVSRAAAAYSFFGRIWGGAMVFAGVILLLHNLDLIQGNVWNFLWPVLLICVGIALLVRAVDGRDRWSRWDTPVASSSNASGTLHEVAVFNGGERRIDSQDFEGGDVVAVFGGIELDLRQAGIKKDKVVIEANAVFGGIDIRVPRHWNVAVRGNGIFGGYDDKTVHPDLGGTSAPQLIVTGDAVFGGVTVRN